MGTRNILAYFNTEDQAMGVEMKLRALRATATAVDRISEYPGDGEEGRINPITGDFAGLGSLALDSNYSGRNPGVLMAVDPDASGMSDGRSESVSGRDVLLTAVIPEEAYERAVHLIEEAGGQV